MGSFREETVLLRLCLGSGSNTHYVGPHFVSLLSEPVLNVERYLREAGECSGVLTEVCRLAHLQGVLRHSSDLVAVRGVI